MNTQNLGLQGLSEVPNLHPLLVHSPIVLLPLALFFYTLGVFRKNESLLVAGRWTVNLALLGTILAVWTGTLAESSIAHDTKIHSLMMTHETIAWFLLAATAVVAVWSFFQEESRPKGAPLFLGVLLLINLAAAQQADLGARMVYVYGAGVKPVMATMEESDHSHGEGVDGHNHESPKSAVTPRPSSSPSANGEDPVHDHGDGHEH